MDRGPSVPQRKSHENRVNRVGAEWKVTESWFWEQNRGATDLPPECGSLGSAAALQEVLYILGLSQPPLPPVVSVAGSAVP